MSDQQSLTFTPISPVAAHADPHTSHVAAREVTRSGERKRQADEVYRAVVRWPGRTSAELAELMGAPRHLTARRLPDLADEKNGALVRRGEAKVCSVANRRRDPKRPPLTALTWWPAHPAEAREGDSP